MRVKVGSKRVQVALAIVAIVVLCAGAAPAEASAAPPRDIHRFGCPVDSPNPFTDTAGSVHNAAIRCQAAYGFVNGTTATTYNPEGALTRGQIASTLARGAAFAGVPLDTSDHGFTDIGGSVHKDAINALANLGVINGTSPTTFSPDDLVSRAQDASFIARLVGPVGSPQLPSGPDAFVDDNGSVHEANINALAAVGILGGVDPDHYNPSGTLSRGAAASIGARTQDFAVEHGLSHPLGGTQTLLAPLTGASEVPGPGDDNGVGTVELVKTSINGLLCLTFDIDTGLSSAATAAHVHQGAPGVAGPIVLTLPTPPALANTPSLTSECIPDVDQSTIDSIFADPAGFYVNIHTEDHPDGAIRGQLSGISSIFAAELFGDQEVPGPGETNASGVDFLDVMDDGTTICSFVFYGGAGNPTVAHIHKAAAGEAGPIVVTLPPFVGQGTTSSDGCVGGLDPTLVSDIAAHPDQYYVNVHTDAFPDGAERGQVQAEPLMATTLTPGEEVPGPGSADGAGDAFLDFQFGHVLCAELHVRGVDQPIAAHIHHGASGVAGPVVVTLPTPTFNTSRDCMEIDPALYSDIVAHPDQYYVNVHTGKFPNGALRGQLASFAPQAHFHAARWNS